MLQSYSAVYCGNQHWSYHGTTFQVVQPSSNYKISHDNEQLTSTPVSTLSVDVLPSDNLLQSECGASIYSPDTHSLSSPDISDKTGPKPNRQRTVKVRNLPSSMNSTSTSNNLYPKPLMVADLRRTKKLMNSCYSVGTFFHIFYSVTIIRTFTAT